MMHPVKRTLLLVLTIVALSAVAASVLKQAAII